MKGGSKASDSVMESNPGLCEQDPVLPNQVSSNTLDESVKINIYKTTGGAKQNKKSKRNKKIKRNKKSKKMKGGGEGHNHNHYKQKGGAKCGNQKQEGGAKCGNQKQEGGSKKLRRKRKSKKQKGGNTKNSHVSNNCQKGGGSDWRMSQYSYGSTSAPDMPLSQFRAFTQTGEYLSNETMNAGRFMK